jgi:redox-sensitive bicupin YhaK (pirin superfamily)
MGPAHLPPGEGIDVRPHPHINLATVTYLFAGAIDHRDSLGTFQTIEPGAVNLMTAGRGIVHSERSPAGAARRRAGAFRHPDLARAAERQGGDRPGLRACAAGPLPVIEGGARGRGCHGHACGARPRRSPATARPSTPTSRWSRAAACRSIPEADERALYVAEGEATLDGLPLEPQRPLRAAPRHRATLRSSARRPCHALRRRAARRAAPRLVELRLLAPRPHQPGQGGLARRPLPDLPPTTPPSSSRCPDVPKTVSYP